MTSDRDARTTAASDAATRCRGCGEAITPDRRSSSRYSHAETGDAVCRDGSGRLAAPADEPPPAG